MKNIPYKILIIFFLVATFTIPAFACENDKLNKDQKDTLNTLLSTIANETKEERFARLRKEYPIEWYQERFGVYCEMDCVDGYHNGKVNYENLSNEERKQIIIHGANRTNEIDHRIWRVVRYGLIKHIIENPEKYSEDVRKFIYHPDVLLGIIMRGDAGKGFYDQYTVKK